MNCILSNIHDILKYLPINYYYNNLDKNTQYTIYVLDMIGAPLIVPRSR